MRGELLVPLYVRPFARNTAEGLAVDHLIIQCLSSLNDESGRDAWEDKMLKDFNFNQDSSAEVLLTPLSSRSATPLLMVPLC